MRRRHEQGFSLIEILVAFVVASLVLGALYALSFDSMRGWQADRDRLEALQVAQGVLEELRIAHRSAEAPTAGQVGRSWSWTAQITQADQTLLGAYAATHVLWEIRVEATHLERNVTAAAQALDVEPNR
ncbi:MAG: type II secretion system protein [Pseudomonadota bacterium]